MHFQDALRAQYFIRALEQKILKISQTFKGDLSSFLTSLCRELDQTLLPTVAYEMGEAKAAGLLKGNSPEKRYQSFFIQGDNFTPWARELPEKYPFLFDQLDQLLSDTFQNLQLAIYRTRQEKSFSEITAIDLLTQSDKHRGQQSLLMTFNDGSKWVYKPRDLKTEVLFARFIQHLDLPDPYNLKPTTVLARENYGWMKFEPHFPCENLQKVRDYFSRAGVLLAVTDTLNFTDGHFENLIASGPYPVLIDGETLFQNYHAQALANKTVLSTGLIQKAAPNQKRKVHHSAFQAKQKETYHILYPHVLHERTDEMQVEFHGYREGILDNLPYIGEKYFLAQDFKECFLNGLKQGYQAIQKNAKSILEDSLWWEMLAQTKARTLMHHTVNYAYLLCRIQQPDGGQSQEFAQALIEDKLPDTPYLSYETQDLLQGNIPYFYHFPNEKTLYDGNDTPYENFFHETAVDQIKRNLQKDLGENAFDLVNKHLDHAKETFTYEPAEAS